MLSRCLGFRGYALENYGISKLRRGQQNFIIIWHMPSTPAYINLKSTVSHTALQYRGIQLFNIEDEQKSQSFWFCSSSITYDQTTRQNVDCPDRMRIR